MRRLKKNVVATYGIIFIIGLAVIGLSLGGEGSSNQVSFSITSPSAPGGDDFTQTIPVSNAVCFAKTTTTTLAQTPFFGLPIVLDEQNSPFLIDNPQFSLNSITSVEKDNIATVKYELKMRCNAIFDTHGGSQTENQEACEDPSRNDECTIFDQKTVSVKPSRMLVEIYAKNPNGNKEQVFNTKLDTNSIILKEGAEQVLLKFEIKSENIRKNMDNGNYDTQLEFRTSGVIDMLVEDFSIGTGSDLLQYYVGKTDIPTYHKIKVVGDTDQPNCDPGYSYNPTSTECELDPKDCNEGREYNPVTNECEIPVDCPTEGTEWNPVSEKCEFPVLDCQSGTTYNPVTDSCQGETVECGEGKLLNKVTGQCVPEPSEKEDCTEKEKFNVNTEKCETIVGPTGEENPNIIDELATCFDIADGNTSVLIDCINDPKFILIWALGLLLLLLIVVAILASLFKPARPIGY